VVVVLWYKEEGGTMVGGSGSWGEGEICLSGKRNLMYH